MLGPCEYTMETCEIQFPGDKITSTSFHNCFRKIHFGTSTCCHYKMTLGKKEILYRMACLDTRKHMFLSKKTIPLQNDGTQKNESPQLSLQNGVTVGYRVVDCKLFHGQLNRCCRQQLLQTSPHFASKIFEKHLKGKPEFFVV